MPFYFVLFYVVSIFPSLEVNAILYFRFLFFGGSLKFHEEHTLVSASALSGIITETAVAIWNTFSSVHLRPPTPEDVEKLSWQFYLDTQFPLVWGALDGKHFRVRNPADAGNTFWCYKKFYSVNVQGALLTLCQLNQLNQLYI